MILISSWSDGLFTLEPGGELTHDFPGRCVSALATDGSGGALAVVDRSTLVRRRADGAWTEVAASGLPIDCCLAVDGSVYAGTEGAHLLRTRPSDRDGGRCSFERVEGFDETPGRNDWFAGFAIIDGEKVGPPLTARSLAGSAEGELLLVGVHVGGIARSADGGRTWQPTIDIGWDVHEVCVHPRDADLAVAASAVGLLVSGDGGATWTVQPIMDESSVDAAPDTRGNHCTAVALVVRDDGDRVLVSTAKSHFADHGTVPWRPVGSDGGSPRPLDPVGGGLPVRQDGIVDTGGIAASGPQVAVVDGGGYVYASDDGGRSWAQVAAGIPDPSSTVILGS